MGMFDRFYIEDNEEIQTKQLDCLLHGYSLGDPVQSYENFDGPTGNYYLYEDYENVGLVVINNIFLDWVRTDGDTRQATRELFNIYVAKPELVALKLSNIIQERLYPDKNKLNAQLHNIRSAVREYKMYKEDPTAEPRLSILFDDFRKFKEGETLESVISYYLKDGETNE
jgi:hypothetical protein